MSIGDTLGQTYTIVYIRSRFTSPNKNNFFRKLWAANFGFLVTRQRFNTTAVRPSTMSMLTRISCPLFTPLDGSFTGRCPRPRCLRSCPLCHSHVFGRWLSVVSNMFVCLYTFSRCEWFIVYWLQLTTPRVEAKPADLALNESKQLLVCQYVWMAVFCTATGCGWSRWCGCVRVTSWQDSLHGQSTELMTQTSDLNLGRLVRHSVLNILWLRGSNCRHSAGKERNVTRYDD